MMITILKKLSRIRLLLPGLAVLFITTAVFIALPATLPSLKNLQCARVSGKLTIIKFETLIWDTPEPPTEMEYIGRVLSLISGNSTEKFTRLGPGKLGVTFDADKKTPTSVYGYLYYRRSLLDDSGNMSYSSEFIGGLPNSTIYLTLTENINGIEQSSKFELTTNWQGYFSTNLTGDPDASCYRIVATSITEPNYNQNTHIEKRYSSTKATYTNCEWEEKDEQNTNYTWIWFVIPGVCVVLFVLFMYGKRRKTKRIKPILPKPEAVAVSDEQEELDEEIKPTRTERVNITFPDIDENLPDVWEVNVPFIVGISQKEQPPYSCTFTVTLDTDDPIQLASDETGSAELTDRILSKGDHLITVSYQGRSGKEVSGWRAIRIVDYREEMVRLLHEMLHEFDLADTEMTPRELEKSLRDKLGADLSGSIGDVTAGFEEANYSIHLVNRASYVRMYRAISEVMRHGR